MGDVSVQAKYEVVGSKGELIRGTVASGLEELWETLIQVVWAVQISTQIFLWRTGMPSLIEVQPLLSPLDDFSSFLPQSIFFVVVSNYNLMKTHLKVKLQISQGLWPLGAAMEILQKELSTQAPVN